MSLRRLVSLVVMLVALVSVASASHVVNCTNNCLVKIGTFTYIPNSDGSTTTSPFQVNLIEPSYFTGSLQVSRVVFAIKGNTVAQGPLVIDRTSGLGLLVIGGPANTVQADCTAKDCIFAAFQLVVNSNNAPFNVTGTNGTVYTFHSSGEGYILPPVDRPWIQSGDKGTVYLHLKYTTYR